MTVDDMLKPGAAVPINIQTVGALISEVKRLREREGEILSALAGERSLREQLADALAKATRR